VTLGKRAFDAVLATFGLIVLTPLFLVVAALEKLQDGGPVFHRAERIGRGGRPFRLWKFRTMVVGAESVGAPLTIGSDPRITRIGRFLRRFKVDELPQLINVVAGDMSLVGPRPEAPQLAARYSAEDKRVFELVPGITDPASIRFVNESELLGRSSDPEHLYFTDLVPMKVRLNVQYATHATRMTDLWVILRTLAQIASLGAKDPLGGLTDRPDQMRPEERDPVERGRSRRPARDDRASDRRRQRDALRSDPATGEETLQPPAGDATCFAVAGVPDEVVPGDQPSWPQDANDLVGDGPPHSLRQHRRHDGVQKGKVERPILERDALGIRTHEMRGAGARAARDAFEREIDPIDASRVGAELNEAHDVPSVSTSDVEHPGSIERGHTGSFQRRAKSRLALMEDESVRGIGGFVSRDETPVAVPPLEFPNDPSAFVVGRPHDHQPSRWHQADTPKHDDGTGATLMGGALTSGDGRGILIDGVSRSFGAQPVIDGASLRVEPGHVAALVGPNGSGKTTLLRILAGVLDPDSGSVSVCGRPPGSGLAGYVQAGERMLNWRLSGRENLRFFARIGGVARQAVDAAVVAAAETTGAADLLGKRAGECSTGQRRRLILAVAFLGSPPVVLIDEPFSDLDDEGCAAVDATCRAWRAAGRLVLYAAPKRAEGPRADFVFRFADGRIREDA
jgi:lipopolysaccharide/colanic/teichoic acid biosynthesis glycosyltransferase/ABC-type Na+ transport system ATPase subunit NatA